MSTQPENEFPTISDLRDSLSELIGRGLGALPVQVLIVPDSTMQAISRGHGHSGDRPALMIEMTQDMPSARIPVLIMSADRMLGTGMPSLKTQ